MQRVAKWWVKVGGVWYKPGSTVTIDDAGQSAQMERQGAVARIASPAQAPSSPSESAGAGVPVARKTPTEIKRMNKADLLGYAAEIGLSPESGLTNAQIAEAVLEYLDGLG